MINVVEGRWGLLKWWICKHRYCVSILGWVIQYMALNDIINRNFLSYTVRQRGRIWVPFEMGFHPNDNPIVTRNSIFPMKIIKRTSWQ